jgi:hypothetical protein
MADERAVQQQKIPIARQIPIAQLHLATEHQPTPNQQPIIAREPMMVALLVIPLRVLIAQHSAAERVEQSEQHIAVPSSLRMERRNERAAKRQPQPRQISMIPLEDVR